MNKKVTSAIIIRTSDSSCLTVPDSCSVFSVANRCNTAEDIPTIKQPTNIKDGGQTMSYAMRTALQSVASMKAFTDDDADE